MRPRVGYRDMEHFDYLVESMHDIGLNEPVIEAIGLAGDMVLAEWAATLTPEQVESINLLARWL